MRRRFSKSGVPTPKTSEPQGVPIPMSAERPQTSSVASSLPTPSLAAALARRRFTLSGAADSQNQGLTVYCRMPFSRSFLSEDQFQCSICLDIFINPASTPCGHSFCMACIGRYWDGAKLCQCPLCKETFKKRPDLQINRTLREITEQFKSMSGVSRLGSGRWRDVLGAGGGGGGGEEADHQDPSTIEREWMDTKTQLHMSEAEIHQLILQRQRKMEEISSSLAQLQLSVERETAGVMCVFSALVCAVERSQAELMEVIEMSRRLAEHQADDVIRQLEQEVNELRKRSHALSQLAQSDDYVHCIKSYPALCTPPPIRDWSGVSVNPDLGTVPIYTSLSVLVQRFQEEISRMVEFELSWVPCRTLCGKGSTWNQKDSTWNQKDSTWNQKDSTWKQKDSSLEREGFYLEQKDSTGTEGFSWNEGFYLEQKVYPTGQKDSTWNQKDFCHKG
ncbi:E3 ubiquitin-protein ligase TRIM65 [Salvelinus sp. IW2-2015]|uniref:E3 ubiquitin-protein ligase TRIM65 n=1 Tax=Salvelinus sp. IW2-2015 TaxID=2691554 RepID=UPI0038D37FDD